MSISRNISLGNNNQVKTERQAKWWPQIYSSWRIGKWNCAAPGKILATIFITVGPEDIVVNAESGFHCLSAHSDLGRFRVRTGRKGLVCFDVWDETAQAGFKPLATVIPHEIHMWLAKNYFGGYNSGHDHFGHTYFTQLYYSWHLMKHT